MWLPVRLRVVLALIFAVILAVPADGETTARNKPDDGLTRDTFTDSSNPPHAPALAPAAPRPRTKRTRLDSKDFLSVHHAARRHEKHAKTRPQVAAATHPPKRRNPVVSFVYWWNGFVIKTFHTKIGTVMLGTVGARS